MEKGGLFEREFLEAVAFGPRCGAEGEKIVAAEILHHDHAAICVMVENLRHAHTDAGEKARDVCVAGVVGAVECVADKDA